MTDILLISRCPPYPLHLGDRLIVYHLARELHARGHTIDLLAFSDRIDDFGDRSEYAGFFREVILLAEPPRTRIDYLMRLTELQLRFASAPHQAWSPEMAALIQRMRNDYHYDVAHLFGGIHVYEYAPLLGELPAIITPYESYALYLRRMLGHAAQRRAPRQYVSTWIELQIARGFERFMFTPYRQTVVVSEPDRAELWTLNSELDVRVIPNGIDLSAFPDQADRTRELNTLLFTGNYEYAPNVDAAERLIKQILPRVRQSIPGAKVQIVGHAPPESLKDLHDEENGVIITGRVPDLRPYLARATVYVSPLRIGAGIKNKILEALAMRCPVAATPLSVDGISVTDGESALIAETDDALSEAVIRLLKDATLRETLGAQGRQVIEQHYTWTQTAIAYEGLYNSVQ